MIKIVSVEKMRAIEAAADAAGTSYNTMMENAGYATAMRAITYLPRYTEPLLVILVGPGNNGGDALVAGRIIAEESDAQVRFYLLKQRSDDDHNFKAVQEAGLYIAYAENDHNGRVLKNLTASADIILDGFFGIGLTLPLRDTAAGLLRTVKRIVETRRNLSAESISVNPAYPAPRPTDPVVIAVDCPSGLDTDTGEIDPNAIHADETITFIAAKPGLLRFPGAAAVGELFVSQIGIPDDLPELNVQNDILVDGSWIRNKLPKRTLSAHKGTFGKAFIAAGSALYTGAPGLAARAAYRSGAGLVTVGTPESVTQVVAANLPEPTWLPLPHKDGFISENAVQIILNEITNYDALLLGPGFGRNATTRKFILDLFSDNQVELPPCIIDADGLNLLSEIDNCWELLPENTIITPHPGEMGRLTQLPTREVATDRWRLARENAVKWGVVLLLKGAHTVIAAPDGQFAVLPFKTDALATAGSGDVLSGIIVGLLAQGLSPYDAAVTGGYLHGLAGQIAGQQHNARSTIAGDVITSLGDAFNLLEV